MKKLSDRQKLFCKYVAEDNNPSTAATKAGYSAKGNRSQACKLMKREEIKAEIRRLQDEIITPQIASVLERKKRLTEIIRAKFTDYFEIVNGKVQWKESIGKEEADGIFEIKNITRTDKSGSTVATTSITLIDPIKAINTLNQMDGLYKQSPTPQKPYSQQELQDREEEGGNAREIILKRLASISARNKKKLR